MSYTIHKASARAQRVIATRMDKTLLDWPPKKKLKRIFPFTQLLVGEAFHLKYFENTKDVYDRCCEFVQRYNRTYFVHFVMLKHDWGYEIARIV